MRNPILVIAIAFALAAPCTALAGEKKTIDVQSYSWGVSNAGSMSRAGSPTTKSATTIPTTTGLTAEGTLGGSTGPTKPPLPTTGTQHR